MSQLAFDERMAAQLDAFYQRRDVLRRRGLVLDALDPQPGDRVVDVGCGPGFYVADVLDRVGPEGAVTGIDVADAMLALAARRVDGRPGATVERGEATSIPLPDASVDRAVSVQVFEYLPDIAAGLSELRRVVRPGGRVVLWDIDWSTLSWHSGDDARMERMQAAWDRHLVHPVLPRTLGASLRAAGFGDVRAEGHLFTTTSMDPETFGGNLPSIIREFVGTLEDVPADEADAWLEDLRDVDARGEYFFALTQFCFTATRED
ncbi:MAG TPA: methyltransferase domain-containing protein [Solirubrobacteraceae bacterium]|jgi:ubiquinone/menaquinone biosynthesis C-methylase UbiE